MKYVKEFGIILIVSLVGELLNYFLPLPVPASIYGLVLMFLCLMLGVIKLSDTCTIRPAFSSRSCLSCSFRPPWG